MAGNGLLMKISPGGPLKTVFAKEIETETLVHGWDMLKADRNTSTGLVTVAANPGFISNFSLTGAASTYLLSFTNVTTVTMGICRVTQLSPQRYELEACGNLTKNDAGVASTVVFNAERFFQDTSKNYVAKDPRVGSMFALMDPGAVSLADVRGYFIANANKTATATLPTSAGTNRNFFIRIWFSVE